MANVQLNLTANLGQQNTGLTNVGYRLYDYTRTPQGSRVGNLPEIESGSGLYQVAPSVPAGFVGYALIDDGNGNYTDYDINAFMTASVSTPTPIGPDSVTFTFNDAGGNPISYVPFIIGGYYLANTGADGSITIGLLPATYTVAAMPTNAVTWSPGSVTVSGTTTYSVDGTAIPVPTPPDDPTLCAAYTYVWPGGGIQATLSIVSPAQYVQNEWVSLNNYVAISDVDGLISFPGIPQGTQVSLSIPAAKVSQVYTLPNAGTYNMT